MTNPTPDLEAMVEPMAWKYCAGLALRERCELLCSECVDNGRLVISLGARIEVPKSPGQRAFETAYDLGWWIGTWEEMDFKSRAGWEQIAAAAREES